MTAELNDHKIDDVETESHCIPIVYCTPFLTAEQLSVYVEFADALIIIAFASGTTPDRLAPVIQDSADKGVAVIMLTNNPGDSFGCINMRYAAGLAALKAGAVLLQKVNVNHVLEVSDQINNALKSGLRGLELSAFIEDIYSFKEGEEIPKAEWDTKEGVASIRDLTAQTLRRIGLSGSELKEALDEWEFGKGSPDNSL